MTHEVQHTRKSVSHHHYHSVYRRGLYSLILVLAVLAVGTFGFHWLEGFSFLDSFYFSSMIATGQGPSTTISPATPLGKIFTCFFAFLSVGFMLASFGFLFGPFLGKLWHIGLLKVEEELHIRPKKKS
jgi:hypothetical protein